MSVADDFHDVLDFDANIELAATVLRVSRPL